MTRKELIAALEKAEAGSRELDAQISCVVRGFTMHEDSKPGEHGIFAFWHGKPWESLCTNCSGWPEYTTSIDAALTLHPSPEFGWSLIVFEGQNGRAQADVNDWLGDGATPALALCIAALKARA